jgi:hypothetical protein
MTAWQGKSYDWALLQPCGTPAAYRRHLHHGEKPCRSCTQAEARAKQDKPSRDPELRRQRYAEARAAGLSPRDALAARDRSEYRKEAAA